MAKKQDAAKESSVIKGALAGLVGGIAGSGAKIVAEKIYPPRVHGETPPPLVLVERAGGESLPDEEKKLATQGIHWGFGAIAGAVYGAAVELEPKTAAWRGAAFGLTLNKFTHQTILPKAGLTEPPVRQRTQEKQSEWVTHLVYGVVTDLVRRIVRRKL